MTTRRRFRLAIAFGLAALAVPPFAAGQGSAGPDTVFYRDRKKDNQPTTARGEVKESAAGVQVLSGGKVTHTLSPADVIRIDYAKLEGVPEADRLRLSSLENKDMREAKDVAAARSAYTDLLKTSPKDARTRRVLEFREAMWAARTADTQTGADFEPEAAAAIQKLTTFIRSYPDGWEIWPAARTAARLQAELGRINEAAATLANLGRIADLPSDLRYEARLEELELRLRSNRAAAESLAAELAGDKNFPTSGPLREKLAVYQAVLKAASAPELAKTVGDLIAKASDPQVRAAAHLALGEHYLAKDRPRDAMWEFLWVETVYNQDRDDVIKAVVRLADVFQRLGDTDRAEEYRGKLPQVKGAL
jgi:tetratricopeptide (TPR) repeat protein